MKLQVKPNAWRAVKPFGICLVITINLKTHRYTNMKNTTYTLLIAFACLFFATKSNAQDYTVAAGLKFGGYENGISGKYFMNKDISLEGVIGFRQHGVVFSGLYEINQEAFNVPALKFYYGFGAHIGSIGQGSYRTFDGEYHYYDSAQVLLGVDGVVGLEYIIPQSPIAVSLDLNPRIELISGPFVDLAPGLGVKYIFK